MSGSLSRRQFVQQASAIAAACWVAPVWGTTRSPNEKLNIAVVGPGGRGFDNLMGVSGENIVAICDVDDTRAAKGIELFPQAKQFRDFRKLFDTPKLFDAVVVSTTDHTHAPIAAWAMKAGKHVYCEKPLTHTVHEARTLAELAKSKGVATQMGTQIHAENNYRRVVELIDAGTIGPVSEVHVWVGKGWGGGELPTETVPIPDTLDWDLWLGPAPVRPYHPTYLPANWRRWWAFGNGTLGDMGCHYIDLVFWALKLRSPTTISAEGPAVHPETAPLGLRAHWTFPARGEQPPVALHWYDGDQTPSEVLGHPVPGAGILFVGSKGHLFADYGSYKLYPEADFAGFTPPPQTIPDSVGHHQEWINACKTGSPTTCTFDYSGALTETVLLGTVAYRVGKTLEWDAVNLSCPNAPEAAALLKKDYRMGWSL